MPFLSLPLNESTSSSVSTSNRTRHGEELSFDQNPEVQAEPLRVLITQRGWSTYRVYSDRASGAKERRPGLDALMADARRGLFDVVIVWRFDRFARSVKQLVTALEEFRSLGIDFVSHQEALDTSTPMGKAMFTIIAAMAELERAIIRERVVAGLDHAQRNGTKSGKPVGRPRVIVDAEKVLHLRDADKLSWPEIGRRTHSSSGTARRVYAAARKQLNERASECNTLAYGARQHDAPQRDTDYTST
jgi:DNA invertase Pin-like site-specific DNA recombinase